MNQSQFSSPIGAMSAHDLSVAITAALRYAGADGQPVAAELLRDNLLRAAEKGDVDAAIILASAAESGALFERSFDEAMKWRVFAAEGGHVPSMISLIALCVQCADHGDPSSYERVFGYLARLAETGLADALFYVGFCLEHGLGTVADLPRAVRCYRKASDRGSIPARFWLALFRLIGADSLPVDAAESERLGRTLDQLLPPRRYGEYSAWPPFSAYVRDLAQIYDWLGDDASRRNYVREFMFLLVAEYSPYWPESRSLHVAAQRLLTTFSQGDWQQAIAGARERFEEFPPLLRDGKPYRREEAEFTYAGTYVVEQYRYGNEFYPRPGDVAMCCGACLGDSTLWLADRVGSAGKVYAFEPFPDIFSDLKQNLANNHADNAFPFQIAIGGESGTKKFSFQTFGSSRLSDDGEIEVEAMTIDDFCARHGVVPDFIKMDIEGVEPEACRGARQTIVSYKPRLAICLYHKPFRDMREIPLLLKSYRPDYRFFMRKCAVQGETVLYAL